MSEQRHQHHKLQEGGGKAKKEERVSTHKPRVKHVIGYFFYFVVPQLSLLAAAAFVALAVKVMMIQKSFTITTNSLSFPISCEARVSVGL